jgi:hypothetical protein
MSETNDSSNIIWSIVDGEAVLLDTSSGHYYSLNPLATEIWQSLQRGDSIPQIVERIASRYGVEVGMVRSDLTELLGELRKARIWN